MKTVLGIDPGAVHCGFAWLRESDGEWDVIDAMELEPRKLYQLLEGTGQAAIVVLEEYRLYPWLLQQQGFSAVETVEVIGIVKYICGKRGIPVVMQGASLKKPAAGLMRARGIEQTGSNQHVRDAEMHAWYYVLKQTEKEK